MTFSDENLNTRNILCNVRRPIPILVAKVQRRNLDYAKNLAIQAKYFTGENTQSMVIWHDQSLLQFGYNIMCCKFIPNFGPKVLKHLQKAEDYYRNYQLAIAKLQPTAISISLTVLLAIATRAYSYNTQIARKLTLNITIIMNSARICI